MIDTQETLRRQKMVSLALYSLVGKDQIKSALSLLHNEFRSEPVFSVQRFVERYVEIEPELRSTKGTIFKALLGLRGATIEQLEQSVVTAQSATDANPQGESAYGSNGRLTANAERKPRPASEGGWPVVFNHFLNEISELISNQNPRLLVSMHQALASQSSGWEITPISQDDLQSWAAKGQARFSKRTNPREMHQILHHIYLWLCQELGPVDTDKLFVRGMKSTESLPEAAQYPPRSLL